MSNKQTEREAYHAGYQAGYENGKRDAVRHGYWIDTLEGWKCSKCDAEQDYAMWFKFCPSCGAKMDGKESEDAEIH